MTAGPGLHNAIARRQELWGLAAMRRVKDAPVGLTESERLEVQQLTAYIELAHEKRRAVRHESHDGRPLEWLDKHSDAAESHQQRWAPWRGYMHEGERWQERLDINYGRARRRVKTLSQIEGDSRDGFEHDDPAERIGTPRAMFKSRQREYRVPLGDDGSRTIDFLTSGGWHIEKAGPTGGKLGRAVKGATSKPLIRQRLEAALRRPLANILVEAHLGIRGPKSKTARVAYGALARIVCELVDARERPVNRRALADALECDRSTVDALVKRGRTYLPQKSPKGGEESNVTVEQAERLVSAVERIADAVDPDPHAKTERAAAELEADLDAWNAEASA